MIAIHANEEITYNDFLFNGGIITIVLTIFMIIVIEIRYNSTLKELLLQNKVKLANKELNLANKNLKKQKTILEVKNTHITESIRYAKSIQDSILGPTKTVESIFPDSFVFFKPKDIVSGDFYFFHEDKEKNIKIAISGDCTGHGVPAALMTTIGSNSLKQIIVQNKIYQPSQILTQLDKTLTETLSNDQNGHTIRDGIDISIVSVKENKLYFAGAKNSLLYLPHNKPIQRIKGNKASVGNDGYKDKIFTDVEIDFNEGDKFYIYTDGFQDQMNEKTNKKYMTKKFRHFLESTGKECNSYEQMNVLEEEFNGWKGSAEQTDDVLIIGIGN